MTTSVFYKAIHKEAILYRNFRETTAYKIIRTRTEQGMAQISRQSLAAGSPLIRLLVLCRNISATLFHLSRTPSSKSYFREIHTLNAANKCGSAAGSRNFRFKLKV